jgi:hypothetical protein
VNILPNSHFTDVLNQKQLKWLADRLPEPSSHTKPAYPNIVLLPGILKLLRGGCRRRRFRYDYTGASFRGFVLPAFLVVCVRRLVV